MTTYRVTWVVEVEMDEEDPEGAVLQAATGLPGPQTVVCQVRQAPFDRPSPMWDVLGLNYNDGSMTLRRLR